MGQIHHTWHPNTFGLLYGKTTKTACSLRRVTSELVKPLETTCPRCQDVIIEAMIVQQDMWMSASEIAHAAGFSTITEYIKSNKGK